MSIFDRMFKLNTTNSMNELKQNALGILMQATHNKITLKETERLYDLLSSNAMSLASDNLKVYAGMRILTQQKADWLTNEEKESFVAGVWLCECGKDSKNNKGITYINPEELKYTKYAILGTAFKAVRTGVIQPSTTLTEVTSTGAAHSEELHSGIAYLENMHF